MPIQPQAPCAEAIDALCTEVKAMHSELHAARQAAAAVDADLPQEGQPAPLDASTATEVTVVGSVPTSP